MSYYFRYDYEFTDHAIVRAKERLNLKQSDSFIIKAKCMEMINNSTQKFTSGNELYIRAANTDYYFVINDLQKLILTVTKISPEKQLGMYTKW